MASLPSRRSTRTSVARRKAPVVDDSDDENQTPQSSPDSSRDDQDSFTPAPEPEPVRQRGARRGRPRKVPADSTAPAASSAPRRRTRTTSSVEPEQRPSSSSLAPEPSTTRRRGGGRVRRISRVSRMSSVVSTTEEESGVVAESQVEGQSHVREQSHIHARLPTASPHPSSMPGTPVAPQAGPVNDLPVAIVTETHARSREPTASPRPPTVPATPLGDITGKAVNERPAPVQTPHKVPDRQIPLSQTPMAIDIDAVVRKNAATLRSIREPVAPKNRLVITQLILTNFKSYAGQQVVGPFHPSFSSVVGPNGSGKSNVIDSLLFVFGFRASKMRQGKISALIHHSAAFPNLEYCEVEVHFQQVIDQPHGPPNVIPNSSLVVSRRAFKNNNSKYYIDGKESSFKVVTDVLKGYGVDLDHKRFLILQGEVESIAQMKPKAPNDHEDGLLEYLEDLIGTSKYKDPIQESWNKLEELEQQVHRKEGDVELVGREKDGLEGRKNEALAYLRDQNELAQRKGALYQLFIANAENQVHLARDALADSEARLAEEVEKHRGIDAAMRAIDKEYKAREKAYEKLEQGNQDKLKALKSIETEAVKFEEKKKYLASQQKKAEKKREASRMNMSSARTRASQRADDIERYSDEIASLEQQKKAEEKELESLRASLAPKTQGLSDEIVRKQAELEPWRTKILEKASAIDVAKADLNLLRKEESAGANEISELEAKISAYRESKEGKRVELKECKAEKKSIETEIQEVRTKIADLAKSEPVLKTKLSSATQKADEARASLSSTQNRGAILASLMRLSETGRISGFHGRLGNLGTIPQKYDVAITTACPGLDSLVVDTVETAEKCIDYLKKNGIGRARFICLDRQRNPSRIEIPEGMERLFDLVQPKDEKFGPAFYHAIGNTLVAKDLSQASRFAYGKNRRRIVTLNGELIEASGLMSGGGNRARKGGMSSKLVSDVTKDQVVKFEHDRDSLDREFAELQTQQRELETILRRLNDQLPQMDTKVQKLAMEVESFDHSIVDAERRIAELRAEKTSTGADKNRISELEKTIAIREEEKSNLEAEIAGAEAEIKGLEGKISQIGGAKLRSQKAKVDGLREQIQTIITMKSQAEESKSTEEKQFAKHEKDANSADQELEKLAIESTKVEEALQAHSNNATNIRQEAEEAQEALETATEELQKLKRQLDEQRAESNNTKSLEIEMRNKFEEGRKKLKEHLSKLQGYQGRLENLKEKYQNLRVPGVEGTEWEDLPMYTNDELKDIDQRQLEEEIAELEDKIDKTIVDTNVLDEYRKRVEEHAARSADLGLARAEATDQKRHYKELSERRLKEFNEGMTIINEKLKDMYRMITMGGNAELDGGHEPFDEGIQFRVKPPRKGWNHISNLSGGEKTLSSLALVFALHYYKPTPLYVMDEIDAALDFRNVSIVANYIKERTKNAQFIVISLRNNMFELAARLVGVYKVNQMTKSVTLENKDYVHNHDSQS